MSQKTNSMIKLALVFFISLLSFSIGTYVGKKYSDNQHKLAALEPHKGDTVETASNEFAHPEGETIKPVGEGQNLTDSEVAKIAEEFANEPDSTNLAADEKNIASTDNEGSEIKSINEKPKPTVTPTATAKVAKTAATKSLTQTAIENINKMQAADKEREPASLQTMKDANAMHFTVQVGSFPTEGEATKMAKEMLTKGFKTSFTPAQVNGQTWYRVNVGLFGSVKEAQDYKKNLLEKTKLTSAIVQKIQN